MIHFFLGQKDKSGNAGRRALGVDGTKDGFVIYCRRCHRGLCELIEIGAAGPRNVIFVEPHECGELIPYPENYQEAARDPRNAV